MIKVYAQVLSQIMTSLTLTPTEHPEPSIREIKATKQNQTREGHAATQTFLSHTSLEKIDAINVRTGECSVDAVAKRDTVTEQRMLANTAATDEESIEEMVRQLERELDKEFEGFEEMKHPCLAAAAEAPE